MKCWWKILLAVLLSFFSASAFAADGGTLVLTCPWGKVSNNFNPFITEGVVNPATNVLYESLFVVNDYVGGYTPVLGTSYKWEDGFKTLEVELRRGVQWSDGKPFTSEDVVFSYEMAKKHKALDPRGIWTEQSKVESVRAEGKYKIVFTFREPNTPYLAELVIQKIAPKHLFSAIDDPVRYPNTEPVGTGPFTLSKFDRILNKVVLKRNPNYWMEGRPYVDQVVMQVSKSNEESVQALLKGKADWGHTEITNVHEIWTNRNEYHKFWAPSANTNILYVNTRKRIFADVEVRKAVSMVLDREELSRNAYDGIAQPVGTSGMLPEFKDDWLSDEMKAVDNASMKVDVAGAKKLLADKGYTIRNGKLHYPNGDEYPKVNILVGTGWTDFIIMAQLIKRRMEQIGIKAMIDQQDWNTYIMSVQTGTYDTVVCWGTGKGPGPYYLYVAAYGPGGSAGEIGESAASGYARYTHPDITKALNDFAKTSDAGEQKAAINDIVRRVTEDVPLIPLVTRWRANMYSSERFVGWPDDDNPYSAGKNPDSDIGYLLLINVKKR